MEQAQVGGGGLGWAGSAGSATGGEVLATLSLVNVAELRGLPGTVFKTYLVPCAEPVAEAMAEAMAEGRSVLSRSRGRHQGQTRGRSRRGSRTARSTVRARVGGEGLAPEHVATVKTYWEGMW